jgi:hypothetical protein
MNSTGPLRQPDSQRGQKELGGAIEFIQEPLSPPSWLNKKERDEFNALIDKQRAAGVGMRSVDAESYGNYVRMMFDFRAAKDPRERLAIRRGMDALGMVLCIGEYPRQRVGIRGKKAQQKGKLALMLERRNGTTGTE